MGPVEDNFEIQNFKEVGNLFTNRSAVITDRDENVFLSTPFRPTPRSILPPIQKIQRGFFSGRKAAGAWSLLLTYNQCPGQ
jgi:hypothetical protein